MKMLAMGFLRFLHLRPFSPINPEAAYSTVSLLLTSLLFASTLLLVRLPSPEHLGLAGHVEVPRLCLLGLLLIPSQLCEPVPLFSPPTLATPSGTLSIRPSWVFLASSSPVLRLATVLRMPEYFWGQPWTRWQRVGFSSPLVFPPPQAVVHVWVAVLLLLSLSASSSCIS